MGAELKAVVRLDNSSSPVEPWAPKTFGRGDDIGIRAQTHLDGARLGLVVRQRESASFLSR